jgi:hypothetical protein
MNEPILVKIIAAPVACKDGIKESWRDIAEWAAGQLQVQYGKKVHVHYYDLFDPDCPALPAGSQLPIVFVNETLISNGGKISIPLIRKKIEALGVIRSGS